MGNLGGMAGGGEGWGVERQNWSVALKKLPLKKLSFITVKHVFVTFPDWFILHVSTRILRVSYKLLICEEVDDNFISDCPRMVIIIENSVSRKKLREDNNVNGEREIQIGFRNQQICEI